MRPFIISQNVENSSNFYTKLGGHLFGEILHTGCNWLRVASDDLNEPVELRLANFHGFCFLVDDS